MTIDSSAGARPGLLRWLATWLALCLWALSGQAFAALAVSTDAVSLPVNSYKTVQVTGARGSVRVSSANKAVAAVSVKDSEDSGARIEIVGKAMGSTTVTVKDRSDQRVVLAVTVTKAAFLTVTPSSLSVPAGGSATLTAANVAGSLSARVASSDIASVSVQGNLVTVRGRKAGSTVVTVRDRKSAVNVPVTVTSTAPPMTVSPTSLSIAIGGTATVTASNAAAPIAAASSNTAVATASVASGVVTVRGVAAGTAVVAVSDGKTTVNVTVTVSGTAVAMTASPTSLSLAVGSSGAITASNVSGTLSASSSSTAVASVSVSGSTVAVRAVAAGSATVTLRDSKTTLSVPVTVSTVAASGRYSLIAWNDLGMHCMDGDYSVFSILPPYNNLHAQLVNATTGKAVTSGVTLTYEAVADPTGSINTTSAGKSNFWQWSQPLYGASPAADVGLTGFATPSRTARSMVLDSANNWFEASGVPITPFDDTGAKNFYPTVKVTAKDATGKVLASTTTVLPVSDEMNCAACHSSRAATETNSARLAARPAAGWVNDGSGERDWKKNILRLHDEKQAANPTYVAALAAKGMPSGLYAAALAGTPTLCASCHASNALPGTGMAGIAPLTASLHTNHGKVIDPTTMLSLDAGTNRNACYNCHPGSQTKCLRGAMGDAVDASGNATMGCQSCHGGMAKVGAPTRVGWLQQPTCQACHFNGKRTTSAVDAAGNLVVPTDTRFATNANVPAAGFNLFRFSKGHGGMQCEACHGSTHAEYPSSHVNDNLQSIALQGYAGTIRECTACHATVPMTATGGPHGMHTIGQAWVGGHENSVKSGGTAACAYCHGSDFRGTPLSQMKATRTYTVEGSTRTLAAGTNVGCYNCHNGPNP